MIYEKEEKLKGKTKEKKMGEQECRVEGRDTQDYQN